MIRLTNITHHFFKDTPNEVRALDQVNLEVPDGEFITLVGSNGAGKSSLLRVISGQVIPDAGEIWLGDQRVTTWPDHKRAGLVGQIDQNPLVSTAPMMSIEENLALALLRGKSRGLSRAVTPTRRLIFLEALRAIGMGLEERLTTMVGTLSGGQRQSLALVMATLAKPRLLLLDEHTAALDPKAAAQIMQITDQLVRSHSLCALMVTHNMEQAIRWGDRLLMMHRGKIILDLSSQEKNGLTVEDLVAKFHQASGVKFAEDRTLLGQG